CGRSPDATRSVVAGQLESRRSTGLNKKRESMNVLDAPKRTAWGLLFLRVLVGWVFLSEGIQKFLFPSALGVGRFAKIGIPAPDFTGPFVGIAEIVCGTLL